MQMRPRATTGRAESVRCGAPDHRLSTFLIRRDVTGSFRPPPARARRAVAPAGTRGHAARNLVGCRNEISVEAASAETDGKLVRCARACERKRDHPGKPAKSGGLPLEQGGVEARDDGERRPGRLGRAGERRGRRVGAEKEDPPAVRAQDEREREQGDVVLLARCAGEKRERALAAAPEPGERKSLPRMRLLAKCSWLISISPRSQPSPTTFNAGNTTWRSDSSRPNPARLSSRTEWAAASSSRPIAARRRAARCSSMPSDGRSSASAARAASAADRPCFEAAPHPLHASGVGSRVEPEAARRANRPREPVPRLPRAQQLGRDTHPTRELADPKLPRAVGHGHHHTNIPQTLDG